MSERVLRCLCPSYTWGIILYGLSMAVWIGERTFKGAMQLRVKLWRNCMWKSLLVMLWHQLTCRHACFMGIFVALHMLTFSLTIAFDKSVEAGFQLRCGTHTKQSLTSALLHFISVVCAASLQRSPISNLSFPVAIVKLAILECSVFPTTHMTPARASLWLPPISALPSHHYVV